MVLLIVALLTLIVITNTMKEKTPCGRVHFISPLVGAGLACWTPSGTVAASGLPSFAMDTSCGTRASAPMAISIRPAAPVAVTVTPSVA